MTYYTQANMTQDREITMRLTAAAATLGLRDPRTVGANQNLGISIIS